MLSLSVIFCLPVVTGLSHHHVSHLPPLPITMPLLTLHHPSPPPHCSLDELNKRVSFASHFTESYTNHSVVFAVSSWTNQLSTSRESRPAEDRQTAMKNGVTGLRHHDGESGGGGETGHEKSPTPAPLQPPPHIHPFQKTGLSQLGLVLGLPIQCPSDTRDRCARADREER